MEKKYQPLVLAWVIFIISEIFAGLILYKLIAFDKIMWKKGTPEKDAWHNHTWLMGLFMIILNGHGMIIFRIIPRVKTTTVKYIHAIIHTVILVGFIYAWFTIYDFIYMKDRPQFKSWFLHSFLGWLTGVIYLIQWISSIFVYLYLYANQKRRKLFAACHNFIGICILQLSIASACSVLHLLDYEMDLAGEHTDAAMLFMIVYGVLINAIVLNPYLEWPLMGSL